MWYIVWDQEDNTSVMFTEDGKELQDQDVWSCDGPYTSEEAAFATLGRGFIVWDNDGEPSVMFSRDGKKPQGPEVWVSKGPFLTEEFARKALAVKNYVDW